MTRAPVALLALGLTAAALSLAPLPAAHAQNPPRLMQSAYPTPLAAPGEGSPDLPRPPKDPAQRREWLRQRLDELFNSPGLAKAKVSVLVVESDTGRPIYGRGDKTLVNAASNVKIITSAAALALLGPEYRWKTTASVAASTQGAPMRAGGELLGDLYIRGSGDPALSTEDLSGIVADLAAGGGPKIRGGIVADETFFEARHGGPAHDQKNEYYPSRRPASAAAV